MPNNIPVKNEPNTAVDAISKADVAKLIADAVAEALKAAIPAAAVGINQAQTQANNKNKEALIREALRRTERCPICLLPKTACGGPWKRDVDGNDIIVKHEDGSMNYSPEINHVREYVGPKDPNMFKWFQGMIVNGVRFLSNHASHRIWIPKKSDILTQVNAWEKDQKEQSQKRTAEGRGMGYVGPGGAVKTNNQAIGWRT